MSLYEEFFKLHVNLRTFNRHFPQSKESSRTQDAGRAARARGKSGRYLGRSRFRARPRRRRRRGAPTRPAGAASRRCPPRGPRAGTFAPTRPPSASPSAAPRDFPAPPGPRAPGPRSPPGGLLAAAPGGVRPRAGGRSNPAPRRDSGKDVPAQEAPSKLVWPLATYKTQKFKKGGENLGLVPVRKAASRPRDGVPAGHLPLCPGRLAPEGRPCPAHRASPRPRDRREGGGVVSPVPRSAPGWRASPRGPRGAGRESSSPKPPEADTDTHSRWLRTNRHPPGRPGSPSARRLGGHPSGVFPRLIRRQASGSRRGDRPASGFSAPASPPRGRALRAGGAASAQRPARPPGAHDGLRGFRPGGHTPHHPTRPAPRAPAPAPPPPGP